MICSYTILSLAPIFFRLKVACYLQSIINIILAWLLTCSFSGANLGINYDLLSWLWFVSTASIHISVVLGNLFLCNSDIPKCKHNQISIDVQIKYSQNGVFLKFSTEKIVDEILLHVAADDVYEYRIVASDTKTMYLFHQFWRMFHKRMVVN